MKATLSYLYIGERFPELSGQEVIVKEIAEKAQLSYVLLKNRMGIKKRRSEGLRSVFINDDDLAPKKKDVKPKPRMSNSKEEKIRQLNHKFLTRKLI